MMKYSIYTGESGMGPWVSIPCLLQDTSHNHWLHPHKINQEETKNLKKKDQTPNTLHCTGLAYIHGTQGEERSTWNTALREILTRLKG